MNNVYALKVIHMCSYSYMYTSVVFKKLKRLIFLFLNAYRSAADFTMIVNAYRILMSKLSMARNIRKQTKSEIFSDNERWTDAEKSRAKVNSWIQYLSIIYLKSFNNFLKWKYNDILRFCHSVTFIYFKKKHFLNKKESTRIAMKS